MRAGFLPRRVRVRVPRGRLCCLVVQRQDAWLWTRRPWFESTRGSHQLEAQQDARRGPNAEVVGSSPTELTNLFTGNAEGRRARLLTESTPVRTRPCEPTTGSSVARTRGR